MYTDVEVWHEGHEEEAGTQCIMAGVIYIVTLMVRYKSGRRFVGVIRERV